MDSLPVKYISPKESMDDRGHVTQDIVAFQSQNDSTEEVSVTVYG